MVQMKIGGRVGVHDINEQSDWNDVGIVIVTIIGVGNDALGEFVSYYQRWPDGKAYPCTTHSYNTIPVISLWLSKQTTG